MEKLLADNNIKKFCYNLRHSKYYRKIRAKLDKDPEYQNLKNNLINHKKIVERLQKKAQKARRIGADPADAYYELREDLMQKIDYYDFMIVELYALAASKTHPKLLKNMVLEVVDRYFDQEVYEDEMRIRKDYIDNLIKPQIREEIKRFLNLSEEDRKREEEESERQENE
jgi:hypothetical protein